MTSTEVDISPPPRRGPRRVQAVDHAIDVLEVMAQAGGTMGVSDVARRTGLSKATVHHLLGTLTTHVDEDEGRPLAL